MTTIQDEILDRIRREGRGKVFTPKDFLDLGSQGSFIERTWAKNNQLCPLSTQIDP